jgi:hypothetical protein
LIDNGLDVVSRDGGTADAKDLKSVLGKLGVTPVFGDPL